MKPLLLLAMSAALTASAWAANADPLMDQAKQMFKPIPTAPPEIKDNPVTPAKVELGHMLFFEPRLSKSGIISCNTCHNVGLGGVDGVPASLGHGFQKGARNSPTVFNAVFNIAQFWDGRAADLKTQAKGPVQAAVEMNNTPQQVEATLSSMPEYVAAFAKAFPDQKPAVTFDNMARAIEAFEATLLTPNAPFDRYLAGDAKALNADQQRGLKLFMDKGCVACHSGVNIGGAAYYPFGLVVKPGADVLPPDDKGRFMVTNTASDEYVFRAGPLRNIVLTAPYFHSGQVWSLEQAVAIMGSSQLGQQLNDAEVKDITAFLHTLTGDQPKVANPILPPATASTPRPSAD